MGRLHRLWRRTWLYGLKRRLWLRWKWALYDRRECRHGSARFEPAGNVIAYDHAYCCLCGAIRRAD